MLLCTGMREDECIPCDPSVVSPSLTECPSVESWSHLISVKKSRTARWGGVGAFVCKEAPVQWPGQHNMCLSGCGWQEGQSLLGGSVRRIDNRMSVAGIKKVKKVTKTSTKKGDGEMVTEMTTTVTSETSGNGSETFSGR
jgi:hypothetical protein